MRRRAGGRRRLVFAKYCSPSGSDTTGTGSITQPYASIQMLMDNISAGQIGAIRAGTYQVGTAGATLVDTGQTNHGTSATNMRRIMGYPSDARPLLRGSVYINSDYTAIENVDIDLFTTFSSSNVVPIGIARNSRTVTGSVFRSCTVDGGNTLAQGILLGSESAVLYANDCKILGCVFKNILGPSSGGPGHGIYHAMGSRLTISGNIFYAVTGYGGCYAVQIYPNAITGDYVGYNTIDACDGGIVWGHENGDGYTGGGHTIEYNIISNLNGPGGGRVACNVAQGGTSGGNVMTNNHFFNNNAGNGTPTGTTITGSVTADPLYNSGTHVYTLQNGSPAAGRGAYASSTPPLSASV